MICKICSRKCIIDRKNSKGFCGVGELPVVAKAYLHRWEEPCISGSAGSGTVFFSGCNLRCVYCQNSVISHDCLGKEISLEDLGKIYLNLQEKGAHNINLVNPTHFILQIRESIINTKGLTIPVVYNSNGYEDIEGIRKLEGLLDVYLPDLKYFSPEISKKYSGAENYFQIAANAILEMYRQVGGVEFNDSGVIKKGLILRHLILPSLTKESIKVLDWVKANLPEDIFISIMSQYTPYYKAEDYPEINRRLTRREYEKVVDHCLKLGFENGYIQERDSAKEEYIPDFDLEGLV